MAKKNKHIEKGLDELIKRALRNRYSPEMYGMVDHILSPFEVVIGGWNQPFYYPPPFSGYQFRRVPLPTYGEPRRGAPSNWGKRTDIGAQAYMYQPGNIPPYIA
jgi:hypothetical protein